jgi:hypothetical protein
VYAGAFEKSRHFSKKKQQDADKNGLTNRAKNQSE